MPLIHDTARAFMPYPDVPVPHAATGPLAGLRFGVKDLFDVAGYPTSGGQPMLLAMSGIEAEPRRRCSRCWTPARPSPARRSPTSSPSP
jgi:hypothetical protein